MIFEYRSPELKEHIPPKNIKFLLQTMTWNDVTTKNKRKCYDTGSKVEPERYIYI